MTRVILRFCGVFSFVFVLSLSNPVSAAGGHGNMSTMAPMGAMDHSTMAMGSMPGKEKVLELSLPAGNYLLVCNIPGHYAAGMVTPFVVTP
jgi:uncharacterized cupredoxin-like copper-binding protein